MSYQPTIPTGSVDLNEDYLNIQGNFSSLNSQWLVDHVPLTTAPGPSIGFHESIHMVPQSAIVNIAGFGQLYSKSITDVNTDEALFWNTGTGNRTVQLTIPIVPTWDAVSTSGFTFLPGGFLIQWGQASSNTDVTFPLAFPNAVYSITVTPNGSLAVSPAPAINPGASKVKFQSRNSINQVYTFMWMAIGN